MPLATLLVMPQPGDEAARNVFSFEHAMAHRGVMAVMAPLTQWSLMPYFIDPSEFEARPATKWRMNHQQAHSDFVTTLPAYSAALVPGIPTSQNLIDQDYQNQGTREWITFANHQEHLIAANAIAPLSQALTGRIDPFWAARHRLAQTFW